MTAPVEVSRELLPDHPLPLFRIRMAHMVRMGVAMLDIVRIRI